MNTSKGSIVTRLQLARPSAALALSACAALLLCATADAAQPASPAWSVTVKYGDLDLGTDKGAVALYQRIAAAARVVCPDTHSQQLSDKMAVWSCRRQAMSSAVDAVNSPHMASLLKKPRLASAR